MTLSICHIEPIGGHRGMQYYDFGLCGSLHKLGAKVILLTSGETRLLKHPEGVHVFYPFQRIFGGDPKLVRGTRYARGLARSWKICLEQEPSIVHFHFFQIPILDFIFLKFLRRRGYRIAITGHDITPFQISKLGLFWLRMIYRLADLIIVHTTGSKDELVREYDIQSSRVHIILHGSSLEFADRTKRTKREAREKLRLPSQSPMVLCFGQIKKERGIDTLIRAFALLLHERPNVRLVIAGPEWNEHFGSYQELARELGVQHNLIARIEYLPDEVVGLFFSAADIVVLPYLKSYQSGVLFLAHAFEKPIVASAIGGLLETIDDGVTGLLVPPANAEALSLALERMMSNQEEAAQLAEQGLKRMRMHHTWDQVAEDTLAAYRGLIQLQ